MRKLSTFAKLLQTKFASAALRANEATGAVKRNRKFTAISLAQSYVLAFLAKPAAGLPQIADTAAALGVDVSVQAIQQRSVADLGAFFRMLFHEMLQVVVQSDTAMAEFLNRFTEVRLMDSSVISLPASQSEEFLGGGVKNGHVISSMRLQTELDLASGRLCGIQIESGRQTDQGTDRQHLRPPAGSLRITDLGYFNLSVFAMIHAAGAYFLSRTQHTVSVTVQGKTLNLIAFLRSQGSGRIDREVVLGTKNKLACRLIAWRVPEDIENRRRRKLRQSCADRGCNVTKAALESCSWEYLITNLREEQLSFEEAIILYRSRWQIELLFKRWKTHCQIDLLDGCNDESTMMRLWIRLCGAILQHWLTVAIAWPMAKTISFDQLARLIQEMAWTIATRLNQSTAELSKFLAQLQCRAKRRCRRTKRKAKPGTVEMLDDTRLLDFTLS